MSWSEPVETVGWGTYETLPVPGARTGRNTIERVAPSRSALFLEKYPEHCQGSLKYMVLNTYDQKYLQNKGGCSLEIELTTFAVCSSYTVPVVITIRT